MQIKDNYSRAVFQLYLSCFANDFSTINLGQPPIVRQKLAIETKSYNVDTSKTWLRDVI